MEFLKALEQAKKQGISKDEFLTIWEMEFKLKHMDHDFVSNGVEHNPTTNMNCSAGNNDRISKLEHSLQQYTQSVNLGQAEMRENLQRQLQDLRDDIGHSIELQANSFKGFIMHQFELIRQELREKCESVTFPELSGHVVLRVSAPNKQRGNLSHAGESDSEFTVKKIPEQLDHHNNQSQQDMISGQSSLFASMLSTGEVNFVSLEKKFPSVGENKAHQQYHHDQYFLAPQHHLPQQHGPQLQPQIPQHLSPQQLLQQCGQEQQWQKEQPDHRVQQQLTQGEQPDHRMQQQLTQDQQSDHRVQLQLTQGELPDHRVQQQLSQCDHPDHRMQQQLTQDQQSDHRVQLQLTQGEQPNDKVQQQLMQDEQRNDKVQQLTWDEQPNVKVQQQLLQNEKPNDKVQQQLTQDEQPNDNVQQQLIQDMQANDKVQQQLMLEEQPNVKVQQQFMQNEQPNDKVQQQLMQDEQMKEKSLEQNNQLSEHYLQNHILKPDDNCEKKAMHFSVQEKSLEHEHQPSLFECKDVQQLPQETLKCDPLKHEHLQSLFEHEPLENEKQQLLIQVKQNKQHCHKYLLSSDLQEQQKLLQNQEQQLGYCHKQLLSSELQQKLLQDQEQHLQLSPNEAEKRSKQLPGDEEPHNISGHNKPDLQTSDNHQKQLFSKYESGQQQWSSQGKEQTKPKSLEHQKHEKLSELEQRKEMPNHQQKVLLSEHEINNKLSESHQEKQSSEYRQKHQITMQLKEHQEKYHLPESPQNKHLSEDKQKKLALDHQQRETLLEERQFLELQNQKEQFLEHQLKELLMKCEQTEQSSEYEKTEQFWKHQQIEEQFLEQRHLESLSEHEKKEYLLEDQQKEQLSEDQQLKKQILPQQENKQLFSALQCQSQVSHNKVPAMFQAQFQKKYFQEIIQQSQERLILQPDLLQVQYQKPKLLQGANSNLFEPLQKKLNKTVTNAITCSPGNIQRELIKPITFSQETPKSTSSDMTYCSQEHLIKSVVTRYNDLAPYIEQTITRHGTNFTIPNSNTFSLSDVPCVSPFFNTSSHACKVRASLAFQKGDGQLKVNYLLSRSKSFDDHNWPTSFQGKGFIYHSWSKHYTVIWNLAPVACSPPEPNGEAVLEATVCLRTSNGFHFGVTYKQLEDKEYVNDNCLKFKWEFEAK